MLISRHHFLQFQDLADFIHFVQHEQQQLLLRRRRLRAVNLARHANANAVALGRLVLFFAKIRRTLAAAASIIITLLLPSLQRVPQWPPSPCSLRLTLFLPTSSSSSSSSSSSFLFLLPFIAAWISSRQDDAFVRIHKLR